MKLEIYKNAFDKFFIKKKTGNKEYHLTSAGIDHLSQGRYSYKFEESWRFETKPFYFDDQKTAMNVIQEIINHKYLKKQEPKLVFETEV